MDECKQERTALRFRLMYANGYYKVNRPDIGSMEVVSARDYDDLRAKLEAAEHRFTAPIVCMCGSTKFKQTWIAENARLTQEGNIVLAVGLWGHCERKFPTPEVKTKLDDLHKRKIDLCDWVWVLDVGSYIGQSTRSEIEYAKKLGKPIRYLSKEFPDYVEPVDEVAKERDEAQRLYNNAIKIADDNDRLREKEMYKRIELEKQVEGLRAQVAVMRGALEEIAKNIRTAQQYMYYPDSVYTLRIADKALAKYRGEQK